MKKDLRLGVSLSDTRTQLAIVEMTPDGGELKYLDEIERGENSTLAFLPDATLKIIRSFGSPLRVHVAVDSGNALLQTFPLEASLSPAEQEEHLEWEWKNYLPDYQASDYRRTTRLLKANPEQQTNLVLSEVIKQSFLDEVTTTFSSNKIPCQSVGLLMDAAEVVLRSIYPGMNSKNVALVGVSAFRMDVFVYENGQLSAYKYGLSLQPQSAVEFLANELLEFLPEELYVFGSALTYEWVKALKSSLGIVIVLNPFRKFRILPEVKNFSRFLSHEHKFCGCIGSLLDPEHH